MNIETYFYANLSFKKKKGLSLYIHEENSF